MRKLFALLAVFALLALSGPVAQASDDGTKSYSGPYETVIDIESADAADITVFAFAYQVSASTASVSTSVSLFTTDQWVSGISTSGIPMWNGDEITDRATSRNLIVKEASGFNWVNPMYRTGVGDLTKYPVQHR